MRPQTTNNKNIYVYDNYRSASLNSPYSTDSQINPSALPSPGINNPQRVYLHQVDQLAEKQNEEQFSRIEGHLKEARGRRMSHGWSSDAQEMDQNYPNRTDPIYFLQIPNPVAVQNTLIKLRNIHPPPTGIKPRVQLSENWSQISQPITSSATTGAFMPSHLGGDIFLLFIAKKHALYNVGPISKKCLTYEDSIKSSNNKGVESMEVFWCWTDIPLLSLIATSLLHKGITPPALQSVPTKPFRDCLTTFAPGDHRVPAWLRAAQEWYIKYKIPEDEEIHCKCRRSIAERRHGEEPMIMCAGPNGGQCPFGWWHYSCAGIPDDIEVIAEIDWWCFFCRVGRHKLASGVSMHGEKLISTGERLAEKRRGNEQH